MGALWQEVFLGIDCKKNARIDPELGIKQNNYFAFHQNYIDRVMVPAVTVYSFAREVGNDSESPKLAFLRVQPAKAAAQEVCSAQSNCIIDANNIQVASSNKKQICTW